MDIPFLMLIVLVPIIICGWHFIDWLTPAMFVWMSEKYKSLHPEHLENALKNKDKSYMTDFVFPSIIDAGCLDTDILVKSKSIFASSE